MKKQVLSAAAVLAAGLAVGSAFSISGANAADKITPPPIDAPDGDNDGPAAGGFQLDTNNG